MKKSLATIVTVIAMHAAGAALAAEEESYIPWTFDDFDSNGQVVESADVDVEPNYIPWTFDDFDSNIDVIETALTDTSV